MLDRVSSLGLGPATSNLGGWASLIGQTQTTAPPPQTPAGTVFFWCVVLLAAAAMGIAFAVIRKLLLKEEEPAVSAGFSLSDLREMHAQGQLSDEEFDHAKRRMLANTRAQMQLDEPADDETPPLDLDAPIDPPDDPDKNPPLEEPDGNGPKT